MPIRSPSPRRLLAALLILVCAACAGPPGPTPGDTGLFARHGFSAEQVGYLLFDPADGRVLAERGADRAFVPASVAKVPTAVAALALLGPEHRFATELAATGTLHDGVLHGDLYLKGGGDPSLTTEDLASLADGLAMLGVRRVAGGFHHDATALPELAEIDAGQPWTAGYNTGVGALSVNFNRFQLGWTRSGGRVEAGAWSVSDMGRLPLDSVAVEVVPDGPVAVEPAPAKEGGEGWRLAPLPGTAERMWLPVTRPGLAAAVLFRRLAEERGIALPAPGARAAPADAATLVRHDSPPLEELTVRMLRWSNNLSAELIGLAAARRVDPGADTLARAGAATGAWIRSRRPAVAWDGFRLANHSGLSTAVRMTPRQAAAVLMLGGERLAALMPGDEESGPLPGLRAKSGTLAYAKGLAGSFRAASGRRVGFAFFAGDPAQRAAMDVSMDRRVAEMPPEARAWLGRARALQAELLGVWAAAY